MELFSDCSLQVYRNNCFLHIDLSFAILVNSFIGFHRSLSGFLRAGVPNLWTLMPNDLRWSLCNNNRNKGHNKCNMMELYGNHLPSAVCGKTIFHKTSPWCQKGQGPLLGFPICTIMSSANRYVLFLPLQSDASYFFLLPNFTG